MQSIHAELTLLHVNSLKSVWFNHMWIVYVTKVSKIT